MYHLFSKVIFILCLHINNIYMKSQLSRGFVPRYNGPLHVFRRNGVMVNKEPKKPDKRYDEFSKSFDKEITKAIRQRVILLIILIIILIVRIIIKLKLR